jgi:hypothetical protein
MSESTATWFDDENEGLEEVQIEEYELTSSPNDFNILTINSFIESGAVKIPGFQRHYVWDLKRASKLIESIIIGLPVPQVFLYEEGRNSFLVIDGQQRLMSIYYFIKQRFPRKEMRGELRRIFAEHGKIPDEVFHEDKYFEKFSLKLTEIAAGKPNKFTGRNYLTLQEYKTQFDLRTIRNVIVKQNVPKDDDSSIYEMFNRLNTGGINLTPQEIRASLYHSPFYTMLYRVNAIAEWRRLIGVPEADLHMRDIEILLRAFAMLMEGDKYSSSMARFLNRFSKTTKGYSEQIVTQLEQLFHSFVKECKGLPDNAFFGKSGKFSVTVLESVFAAVCGPALNGESMKPDALTDEKLIALKADKEFLDYSQARSTNLSNVKGRLIRAKEILLSNVQK